MDMFRDLLDFSKKRTGAEAAIFYVFYVGCLTLIMLAFKGNS